MASGTRSGKQPASAVPDEDVAAASPNQQQLAIRGFTPEQNTALEERFSRTDSILADLIKEVRLLRHDRQQTSSPILPSIETSPPAQQAPLAPPLPPTTLPWNPYKKLLRAEDVGFFDPEFQASEQEHGRTTPGPVVNAGKHAYYLDIFVFVDRLNELNRKHGSDRVKDVIPSCLRGSALIWWTTEVDDPTKTILEASKDLDIWIDTLIRQFRMNPAKALSALTRSRYSLRDLQQGMSPRIWIHGQLSLARSADLGSTYNQLTMIWNQMGPYFQEQLAQPSPTTLLSDFLKEVDAKTTVWQNRANELHRQQTRASQGQDRPRDPHRGAASAGPTQSSAADGSKQVQFERRPRIWRGKEHSKDGYSYMVTTLDDGTPQWEDEDPDDADDHADYG